MDHLDRPAGQTSWTDQLDRPAGRTSPFYFKPWPVRILKDFPFSLYIVAAFESDKGLVSTHQVCLMSKPLELWKNIRGGNVTATQHASSAIFSANSLQ